MATEIQCRDCGVAHVGRSDAKTCPPCRVLRNLVWATAQFRRPRKCRVCDGEFRPHRAKDLAMCGPCLSAFAKHVVDCAICPATNVAGIDHRVPVCLECAKHPTRQATVISALKKGQARRRQESGMSTLQETAS